MHIKYGDIKTFNFYAIFAVWVVVEYREDKREEHKIIKYFRITPDMQCSNNTHMSVKMVENF